MKKEISQLDLQRYLSLYGVDLDQWPQNLRSQLGRDNQSVRELNLLIEQERQFEQMLLSRHFEMHSLELQSQIIKQSLVNKDSDVISAECSASKFLSQKSWLLNPTFSMAATLIVGLAIGYYLPNTLTNTPSVDADDISDILYVQEELL